MPYRKYWGDKLGMRHQFEAKMWSVNIITIVSHIVFSFFYGIKVCLGVKIK